MEEDASEWVGVGLRRRRFPDWDDAKDNSFVTFASELLLSFVILIKDARTTKMDAKICWGCRGSSSHWGRC